MNKIPTMFERDWNGDRSRVTEEVHPGCEWVVEGVGVATRKYDGTCVMFDGTDWFARREVREGKDTPPGFVSIGHDHVTLKNVGWEPIDGSPFAKFHAEALAQHDVTAIWEPGTYELCGPKVQGNPEKFDQHTLVLHKTSRQHPLEDRSFAGIKAALEELDWEGFVFHHENGRWMSKIKRRDFGLKRGS